MANGTKPLRLAFMGTPDFALSALNALIASPHEIVSVYTQPPRPAGRGHAEKKTPIHLAAEAAGLEVRTPKSLKPAEEQAAFRTLGLDAAIVVAYGLLLPEPILSAPRFGCLNIHPSLLPRWRGAAPIQRALMAGDAETGVAIMQLDAGLDSGPIFATETVPVGPGTTAGSLHDDLAARGARLLLDVLGDLAAGRAQAKPQSDIGVTYAAKIGPEDQHIDWTKGATEIERQIRALSPTPGAWFDLTGARVKLWAADVVDRTGKPGEAIDDRLTIACGAGALRLVTLQREGKKAMAAADFLRGTPIARGTVLS